MMTPNVYIVKGTIDGRYVALVFVINKINNTDKTLIFLMSVIRDFNLIANNEVRYE